MKPLAVYFALDPVSCSSGTNVPFLAIDIDIDIIIRIMAIVIVIFLIIDIVIIRGAILRQIRSFVEHCSKSL